MFEVHGHLLLKPWMQFERVFPPVHFQVGTKLLQKGWGKVEIPADIAVSAEMGFRLEENVGLDLELTSLHRVVLQFGVQGLGYRSRGRVWCPQRLHE